MRLVSPKLPPQRLDRLNARRAAARHGAPEESNGGQDERHHGQSQRVPWPDARQEALHQRADGQRAGQPQRGTDGGQQQAAAEDEAECVARPGAERQPDAISWLRWATT